MYKIFVNIFQASKSRKYLFNWFIFNTPKILKKSFSISLRILRKLYLYIIENKLKLLISLFLDLRI